MSFRDRTHSPPAGPTTDDDTGVVWRIDLDTQCAVLESTAIPCPKPINCPLHTSEARRAVKGRTKPFEMLLSAKLLEEGIPEPEQAILTSSKGEHGDTTLQLPADIPATIAAINLMAISHSQDNPHLEKALIALDRVVQDLEDDILEGTSSFNDPSMTDEAKESVLRVRIGFIRSLIDVFDGDVEAWSKCLGYFEALGTRLHDRITSQMESSILV